MNLSAPAGSSPLIQMIMKQMFKDADADQSGGLSKKEFINAFSQAIDGRPTDGANTFSRLDRDGDGKLTESEFTSGIQNMVDLLQFCSGSTSRRFNPLEAFRDDASRQPTHHDKK